MLMFSGFQERHHWLSIPKCSDSSDLAVLRALECVDTGKVAGFAAWADCLSNPFHGHRAAAGVNVFFREIDEFEAGEGLGEEGMDLLRAPFGGRSYRIMQFGSRSESFHQPLCVHSTNGREILSDD